MLVSPHFEDMFEKTFPKELKKVKTFEELKRNFKWWGGDKASLTRQRGGQLHALAVEAKKIGILPYEQFRFKRNDRVQIRWRDMANGRLVKPLG
jgi:hypothetical protein